jgi:hypothetical protein
MGGTSVARRKDQGEKDQSERVAVRFKFPPRILLVLFFLSLPLVNPWVRGDGVGYYAFVRAPLIQHNLDFAADFQNANRQFRESRLDVNGLLKPELWTATGHLNNHFTVGPAMLWAPFLVCTHGAVLLSRALGAQVSPDGFSLPYLLTMAFSTLLYGFLALLLSYRVTCEFVNERWALFATVAVWWASSLPVYMYFNPSWSHAHSAFAVALFFWYWVRTRETRSSGQWIVLALIGGLMLNVYYPNAIVLGLLLPEGLIDYRKLWASSETPARIGALAGKHFLFCAVVFVSLLPTFITRYIIYGGFLKTGYVPMTEWAWTSPSFLELLFSSNHGLFSWTPLLLFATAGIFVFCRRFPEVGISVISVLLAFYYFMASYPVWAGISSYGNRFFVSLTVFFVLGLAVTLNWVSSRFRSQRAASAWLGAVLSVFVIWNFGLIFQWGAHLIPVRGAVSWRKVVYNQFHSVPREIASHLQSYLFQRKETLRQIEQRDIEQLNQSRQPQ